MPEYTVPLGIGSLQTFLIKPDLSHRQNTENVLENLPYGNNN